MRCAGVLLVLLLYLSGLSASTAQANEERLLRDNAVSLTGRKWLRGQKAMAMAMAAAAGPGHGDVVVMEGKGGEKNTGANTAHVHGSERTVEVTVVGLSGEGAGAGRKSGGKHRFAGLVPFSSDYRTPRTHPPRNN